MAWIDLFEIAARYARHPMIAAESPLRWGSETHVRELFGNRVESLVLERRSFGLHPFADLELMKADHPVFVALYRDVADQPERAAALDNELAEMWRREGGEDQQLLLIVARKRHD
jgi:hypothetical protein